MLVGDEESPGTNNNEGQYNETNENENLQAALEIRNEIKLKIIELQRVKQDSALLFADIEKALAVSLGTILNL